MQHRNERRRRHQVYPGFFEKSIDAQADMEVICAVSSGVEAVKHITECKGEDLPDIILMDIQMEDEKAGITATELTEDEEDIIEKNVNDLLNLSIYSLPTLKINSKADEEDVADIFVRVNSGGQNLTEKNFIETLIAVYDNDVHDSINHFCVTSRIPANGTSYNQILQLTLRT